MIAQLGNLIHLLKQIGGNAAIFKAIDRLKAAEDDVVDLIESLRCEIKLDLQETVLDVAHLFDLDLNLVDDALFFELFIEAVGMAAIEDIAKQIGAFGGIARELDRQLPREGQCLFLLNRLDIDEMALLIVGYDRSRAVKRGGSDV